MITLTITTYNRVDLVIDSFSSVLDNDYINEIVIVDDFSEPSNYESLKLKISELKNSKIKLYRNEANLRPLLNKLQAVRYSNNEWLILLDSDNKIDNEYIEVIKNLEKNKNTLYIPEKLLHFNSEIISDFHRHKNCKINKENIINYLNEPEITTALNVGNFFVNKNSYLDIFSENNVDFNLEINDALYFSYLWIISNKVITIVDDLKYFHRQHDNSWYLNNRSLCDNNTKEIINRLKHL